MIKSITIHVIWAIQLQDWNMKELYVASLHDKNYFQQLLFEVRGKQSNSFVISPFDRGWLTVLGQKGKV